MRATPGILIFQQQFSLTPGKPERETGFLLKKMCGCKCRENLDISRMRMGGGFGVYEQVTKLPHILKKTRNN